jgi:Ran GTPase-activating protein (RanGAP) involved in mRNA processing and transport
MCLKHPGRPLPKSKNYYLTHNSTASAMSLAPEGVIKLPRLRLNEYPAELLALILKGRIVVKMLKISRDMRAKCRLLEASAQREIPFRFPVGLGLLDAFNHLNTLCKVTVLRLHQSGLSEGGAQIVAAMLADTHVRELDLSGNSIANTGAAALATLLRNSPRITQLDLNTNLIESSGCAALTEALCINSVLVSLNLSYNQIEDSIAPRLTHTLSQNTTLTELDLGNNIMGGTSAIALANGLLQNSVLQSLCLRWNTIGDRGVGELAKSLLINTTLRSLDLTSTQCGTDAAVALMWTILENTTLTHLDVSDNTRGNHSGWFGLLLARNVHGTCVVVRNLDSVY